MASSEGPSLQATLDLEDPEVYALLTKEKSRQKKGLEMIASENFTSKAVLQVWASVIFLLCAIPNTLR